MNARTGWSGVGSGFVLVLFSSVAAASGCSTDPGTASAGATGSHDVAVASGQCDDQNQDLVRYGCPVATPICFTANVQFTVGGQTFAGTGLGICLPELTFPACTGDVDCDGPFGQCLGIAQGLATGICSRPVSTKPSCFGPQGQQEPCPEDSGTMANCGDNAVIGQEDSEGDTFLAMCTPACSAGASCPAGFACEGATPSTRGDCEVYCTSGAPCAEDVPCSPYTHSCRADDLTLMKNGEPCAVDLDCRSGHCIPETSSGRNASPTGYLGGFCDGSCVQPADAAYETTSLPAGDCPDDSVCARNPAGGAGVVSRCFPRCTDDSGCRTDYVCVHPLRPDGGGRAADGFCDARADTYSGT